MEIEATDLLIGVLNDYKVVVDIYSDGDEKLILCRLPSGDIARMKTKKITRDILNQFIIAFRRDIGIPSRYITDEFGHMKAIHKIEDRIAEIERIENYLNEVK